MGRAGKEKRPAIGQGVGGSGDLVLPSMPVGLCATAFEVPVVIRLGFGNIFEERTGVGKIAVSVEPITSDFAVFIGEAQRGELAIERIHLPPPASEIAARASQAKQMHRSPLRCCKQAERATT